MRIWPLSFTKLAFYCGHLLKFTDYQRRKIRCMLQIIVINKMDILINLLQIKKKISEIQGSSEMQDANTSTCHYSPY